MAKVIHYFCEGFQGRRNPGKNHNIYSKGEQEITLFILIPGSETYMNEDFVGKNNVFTEYIIEFYCSLQAVMVAEV